MMLLVNGVEQTEATAAAPAAILRRRRRADPAPEILRARAAGCPRCAPYTLNRRHPHRIVSLALTSLHAHQPKYSENLGPRLSCA